jgi:hypothetical protein
MMPATMPYFSPRDDKYYHRDLQRRIGIASTNVNQQMTHIHCKLAFNCSRRSWKEACMTCLYNQNCQLPPAQRTKNYKAVIETDRPLTIDGRIREKMNAPIFLK